jgi:acetolactate synthase-1/2/3 large subunit
MVRQWQTMFFNKRYSHTSLHTKATDFNKLAEAYGVTAYHVTKPEEVDAALLAALDSGKPAVLNCEVGMDEKVFPMVPLGAGIGEFITRE